MKRLVASVSGRGVIARNPVNIAQSEMDRLFQSCAGVERCCHYLDKAPGEPTGAPLPRSIPFRLGPARSRQSEFSCPTFAPAKATRTLQIQSVKRRTLIHPV